jgi:hypothetical protein
MDASRIPIVYRLKIPVYRQETKFRARLAQWLLAFALAFWLVSIADRHLRGIAADAQMLPSKAGRPGGRTPFSGATPFRPDWARPPRSRPGHHSLHEGGDAFECDPVVPGCLRRKRRR